MRGATIIALVALLSGCVSRQKNIIVVPPIHVAVDVAAPRGPARENPIVTAIAKAVLRPETAIGQLMLGCGHFRETSGRWPRTTDEVAAGLVNANLSSAKLAHLEEIRFSEDADALIIDFVSIENGRVQGSITMGLERKKAEHGSGPPAGDSDGVMHAARAPALTAPRKSRRAPLPCHWPRRALARCRRQA